MFHDFLKNIEENSLVKKGEKILLGVSGGIDSMTDLFLRSGLKFGIAHCNFCLRKKDSDKDESMVRKYAADNDIPFFSIRFKTLDYARKKGISVEMAARELRYEWFEKIRRENGFDSIAIAHNLNDNIETFILNLTRGTGIAGLTGMRISGNHIIRPLLFATRQSIKAYSKENRIFFREDKTNADIKFIRNKIRHKVIPLLKEINPSFEFTLNDTAERLNEVYSIISGNVEVIRKAVMKRHEDTDVMNISNLKPHLGNSTILFELFRPYALNGAQMNELRKIIVGRTGGQIFTLTYRIIKNRNEIIISGIEDEEFAACQILKPAGLKMLPLLSSVKTVNIRKGFEISRDIQKAFLDHDKIVFPLIVRKWKPGDYFYPLGMKSKKKLSDYFIDRKFSRLRKEKTFILESDGKIVWIIGERIDNRFRITNTTRKALILTAQNLNGAKAQR